MNLINSLIDLRLKIKEYKLAFLFLFLFWLMGFLSFLFTETSQSLGAIFLMALGIRNSPSDFGGFYSLMWPILLEVVVFGFIIGELLEKYNPIITSKILSTHQSNHTVIIGFQHLSERIIEHCIENKDPFVIIEDDEELVEDLISSGHPVVVGDATENSNLLFANIKHAKEVFICINDVRIAIICTEKIREYNQKCPIYVRAFEEHVQDFLEHPPLNAYSFSMSEWAMEGIIKWTNGKKGKAIVIGRDHLTQRIAHHISLLPDREVYFFNDESDGIVFKENPQLHIINECACFLSDLRDHVDLDEVTQVFICWKKESDFDESIYLTSKLHLRYPNIEVFLRIFDEGLMSLAKRYKAKTFSSSTSAFEMLQEKVKPNSAIYPERK